MMPRKKKNGSRSDSPEKPPSLQIGFPRSPTSSQYGSSNMGKWGDTQRTGQTGTGHVPDKTEQDQRFHQLQEMFNGQVDADVVYVILSECDWKVEDAVEKLLELTLPASQNHHQGPTLKTVASTITSSSTMASDQAQSGPGRQDLGLNLRSRLPSVQNSDPVLSGGLPMLSPRTPSVVGLEFPSFPQGSDRDDSIHVALEALDSYANPNLSSYISSFQTQASYDSSNIFDTQIDSTNQKSNPFDSFAMPLGNQGTTGHQHCPSDGGIGQFAGMPAFGSQTNSGHSQDSVPYANLGGLNIYSQTFQPIQTTSPPVLQTPTYTTATNSVLEPVSPRTAFNSVIFGDTAVVSGISHKRPVREDSKDSATSDVSRVSDLSHASEESVVDLSPGLVPKRHHRQVLRRQNISLDPQERASLEQLIEEVLIGGVDDGVMDSDDSSDDDDDEYGEGHRIKRLSRSEDPSKVTPSQLKVAAKHMRNLPPRFLKRLQATQPNGNSGDEEGDAEGLEVEEPRVEEKKKPKKKTKHLLDSLNQYVEDDVPVTDPESEEGDGAVEPVESPGAAPFQEVGRGGDYANGASTAPFPAAVSPTPQALRTPQQPIVLRPNVMNYNDLDPERLVHTPPRMPQQNQSFRPQSRDHTPEPPSRLESQQHAQRFSLDAPEFVPRSFNPIHPPPTHTVASPMSHMREGFVAPGGFCYTPRSGSPYTVHSGSPYPGRSGSPYHRGLSSNLSPQMARRTMTGSPIAMMQVAPTGRHSPIPPAFFIPKAPPTAAAAAAAAASAAIHGHAGLLPYTTYPVPHFPVHPGMRYAVPPGYRPPFMPPGTGAHRMGHPAFKYSPKDRLQNSSRPNSAPAVAPGASTSPRMAANLQPQTVQLGAEKHATQPQKGFGKPSPEGTSKLDKDGKEAKNLSTQGSRNSKSSVDEDISPQEKVENILSNGAKLMVILRGVPGSGKTHLARELVNSGVICSTDDFFVTSSGYEFDYGKIGEAHEWNQKRAKQSLQEGKNPVIIDNTNTQAWEMRAYVLLAVKHDYMVEILEPDTPWKFRAKELAKRNKHGVTKEFIQRMIDRYDHNVTLDTIVASSEKIKVEVERKQRLAAQQMLQESGNVSQEGQPPEERKTKKKTRRGKGRKKKARLRELREAEANKEREKTGDEASSDEESTPEGDQSVEKACMEEKAPTEANCPDVPGEKLESTKQSPEHTCNSERHATKVSLGKVDDGLEKEEQSTPEKKLHDDSVSDSSNANKEEEKSKVEVDGNVSDESDSSRDSLSEPSTVESNLDQDSGSDLACREQAREGPQGAEHSTDPVDMEDMMRDEQLLTIVMTSLKMNLHAMLQTKQGPAKAQLKKLLAKYETSAEVQGEIKEIIKEKMFEGMVNREVEEITSNVSSLQLEASHGEPQQSAAQYPKSLTATDVNSIMDVLGQITNVDSDTDNDSNNNQSNMDRVSDESVPESDSGAKQSGEDTVSESKKAGEITVSSASSAKDLSAVELAYWQADRVVVDPYSVGSGIVKPRTKSQASWSDSSSSEVNWENRPKVRRERKRPYKKPKEFWNVSSDKPEENGDSANSSLVSSEPGTPQTPTTPEDGVRSRRLSGRNRLAAQFPMPELNPDEKPQLIIKDWQLPDFTAQQVPFSVPVHQAHIATLDAETYTHPKDFAAIQRLMQRANGSPQILASVVEEGFMAIRDTVPRIIYEGDGEGDDEQKAGITHRLMIHQSCSTRELEEESRPDGLIFLKSCFASVAEEDLAEILDRCEGDVEWAANILLDAGYEYNEQPTQPPPTVRAAPGAALTDTDNREGQADSIESVREPPALTQICHQHLQLTETLTDKVQEKYVATSLQRLNSITEFQRERSTSSVSESGDRQQQQKGGSRMGSLDLAPSSPGSDIFLSPLVTPFSPGSPFAKPDTQTPLVTPGGAHQAALGASSAPPVDGGTADEMTLTLSRDLAQQLIALFGPVGFHISSDSLASEDLVVKLTRKTAKQLHRRWALTLQDSFHSEETAIEQMIQQDEALAKRMQAEEDQNHKAELERAAASQKQNNAEPESLKEIMEEQMAIELSKKEHGKIMRELPDSGQQHADSLATKMKRQKLWQMFPTVDRPSLEEVYKASGYNMTTTASIVRTSFGVDEPVQNVWTPEAMQAYEDMLVRQAVNLSLQDEWLGADENEEADALEALEDPQYQDLRAEASAHYRLRHECFQKAQEAYRRGLKAVACFYSQQGHLHTQRLKEANNRAAMKMIELRNQDVEQTNTIDLHGLHVDETLSILGELITQRERELRQRPDKRRDHLFVVTGRGSHSRGGKAKIRPAVIDYLTRKHYSFSEGIPGMLKVQMKYRDDL